MLLETFLKVFLKNSVVESLKHTRRKFNYCSLLSKIPSFFLKRFYKLVCYFWSLIWPKNVFFLKENVDIVFFSFVVASEYEERNLKNVLKYIFQDFFLCFHIDIFKTRKKNFHYFEIRDIYLRYGQIVWIQKLLDIQRLETYRGKEIRVKKTCDKFHVNRENMSFPKHTNQQQKDRYSKSCSAKVYNKQI